jgi:hypothetical protein
MYQGGMINLRICAGQLVLYIHVLLWNCLQQVCIDVAAAAGLSKLVDMMELLDLMSLISSKCLASILRRRVEEPQARLPLYLMLFKAKKSKDRRLVSYASCTCIAVHRRQVRRDHPGRHVDRRTARQFVVHVRQQFWRRSRQSLLYISLNRVSWLAPSLTLLSHATQIETAARI